MVGVYVAALVVLMVVCGLWNLVKNGGLKIVKNGPRVWAFCKIEFPGIQKPVQFFGQKSGFFRNPGNRGVGVIWLVRGGGLVNLFFLGCTPLALLVDVCSFLLVVCCYGVVWFVLVLN